MVKIEADMMALDWKRRRRGGSDVATKLSFKIRNWSNCAKMFSLLVTASHYDFNKVIFMHFRDSNIPFLEIEPCSPQQLDMNHKLKKGFCCSS